MMKMLELYSGTGSISKEFEKLGFKIFTIDNDKRHNPSMVADISKLKLSDLPLEFQHPDVVWASPDCRYFSVAALSRNWELIDGKYIPRRKEAEEALKLLERTVELINELNPKYWFIENPRGMMRKMTVMESLPIRNTVTYCFSGDTEIISINGVVPISSLENREEFLLSNGKWVKSMIRNYGEKSIWKITLSRSGRIKTIKTTSNHKWFVETKCGKETLVETEKLVAGNYLKSSYPNLPDKSYIINNEWVCRGFVMGDGYVLKSVPKLRKERAYGLFCGNKIKDMLPFFDGFGGKRMFNKKGNVCKIQPLPPSWKTEFPSISDDKNDIYSWLSGYFSADGTVSKRGQCVMASSSLVNIRCFEKLCNIVGIRTTGVKEYERLGYGTEKTSIYYLDLDRTTLGSEFFHIKHHLERFEKNKKIKHSPKRWTIEKIEETENVETVFCAEVPEFSSFTLDGNILTHNCQYGDTRQKPTDIFTNCDIWTPRPMCKPKAPCHVSAPRGSTTGTQGLKNAVERSRIPAELGEELAKLIKQTL